VNGCWKDQGLRGKLSGMIYLGNGLVITNTEMYKRYKFLMNLITQTPLELTIYKKRFCIGNYTYGYSNISNLFAYENLIFKDLILNVKW
jgi:hypothetical protein